MSQLRVWWVPQVPMPAFYVSVKNLVDAKLVLNTLANYDRFQMESRVKGDYANAGGLQLYDEDYIYKLSDDDECDGWVDWYDEEGNDIDQLTNEDAARLDEEAYKTTEEKLALAVLKGAAWEPLVDELMGKS